MNEHSELDLLVDIAKLLKKYGAEAFERLAETTSQPNFAEHLASVLRATANAAPETIGPRKAKASTRDLRYSLVKLEKTDAEKSAILVNLYDGLMAKTMLPTVNHVKSFATEVGLEQPASATRDKAVFALIQSLMPLHVDDVKAKLTHLKTPEKGDDRSMEGWNDLILSTKRRETASAA